MVRVRDLGFWVCVGVATFLYIVIIEVEIDHLDILWLPSLFLVVFTAIGAMILADWWREGEPTNTIAPGEYGVCGTELVEKGSESFWLIFAQRIVGEDLLEPIKAYRLDAKTVHVQDGPRKLQVIRGGRLTKVVLTLPQSRGLGGAFGN